MPISRTFLPILCRFVALSYLVFLSSSLATAQVPFRSASLNGNWNLAGDHDGQQFPVITINLAVDQERVRGAVHYDILCSEKIPQHFTSDIGLQGEIDPAGHFTLSTSTSQVELAIHGTVPARGAQSWKGTYTFTIPPFRPMGSNPYGDCESPQAGSFTATTYPSFDGTYIGSVDGGQLGKVVSVTIKVSQAPFENAQQSGFPLSATISVQGSPCLARGVSRAPSDGNHLVGNHFDLNFKMDNGASILMVEGLASGPGFATLTDVRYQVGGMTSKCFPASGTGTLTKQTTAPH